jgi:hypothetical protein
MLDAFGQEVIHVIADAIAKGVTDFPHTLDLSHSKNEDSRPEP